MKDIVRVIWMAVNAILLLTSDNIFLRLLGFVAIVLMIIAICLKHGLIVM